jgi:hypothetical protein
MRRAKACHPEDLIWSGAEISVTTPLGTAHLCLRVGDSMSFVEADGAIHVVFVEGSRTDALSNHGWNCHHPAFGAPEMMNQVLSSIVLILAYFLAYHAAVRSGLPLHPDDRKVRG